MSRHAFAVEQSRFRGTEGNPLSHLTVLGWCSPSSPLVCECLSPLQPGRRAWQSTLQGGLEAAASAECMCLCFKFSSLLAGDKVSDDEEEEEKEEGSTIHNMRGGGGREDVKEVM